MCVCVCVWCACVCVCVCVYMYVCRCVCVTQMCTQEDPRPTRGCENESFDTHEQIQKVMSHTHARHTRKYLPPAKHCPKEAYTLSKEPCICCRIHCKQRGENKRKTKYTNKRALHFVKRALCWLRNSLRAIPISM